MEKTLKEHLAEARAKRWKASTPEVRKAHAQKMSAARWNPKKPNVEKAEG